MPDSPSRRDFFGTLFAGALVWVGLGRKQTPAPSAPKFDATPPPEAPAPVVATPSQQESTTDTWAGGTTTLVYDVHGANMPRAYEYKDYYFAAHGGMATTWTYDAWPASANKKPPENS